MPFLILASLLAAMVTILIIVPECATGTIQEETNLHAYLLQGYSNAVRPNKSVEINVRMTLNNLIELDIVNEHMTVSGSLWVSWDDHRLQWDAKNFNNTRSLYFTVDEIWRPLMVLANGADAICVLGDDSEQRSIPILVLSSGTLFWIAPAFFKSLCTIDVSMFPFDTQTCEIVISSWMFGQKTMSFTSDTTEVLISHYKENGEYHLVRTFTEIRDSQNFGDDPWSYAVFGMTFRRRYSYYVINMVVPVLFLEILGVLVFILPASSGEKLAYSLTLLLSLVVIIGIVAEKIPSTSLHVPLLSIFVLEGVALSVLEVLFVVYILNLRYWHETGKELGPVHLLISNLMRKRCSCKQNKVDRLKDDVVDIRENEKRKESLSESYIEPLSETGGVPQNCSYEAIARTVEIFSFWLFTTLVITFFAQAFISVYKHYI